MSATGDHSELSTLNLELLAAARRDTFDLLRYTLEFADDIADADLDALVEAIAAPIIAATDCTQCARCCCTLDVYLTPEDAARLAEGLGCDMEQVLAERVDRESAALVDEWGKLRGSPCPFLVDRLCTIYPYRPESCRLYPVFTPDFRWTLEDLIPGAAVCPIIMQVLDALAARFAL